MNVGHTPTVFRDEDAIVFAFAVPGTEVQVHMTPYEAARNGLRMVHLALSMPGMDKKDAVEIKAALDAAAMSH